MSESIDPISLEVIRNGLEAVAEEMNATLIRTAYSPNIKERRDCSCALFDANGEMISQAENIPVHLGAMPFSVRAAIDEYPIDDLEPGDGVILNDPFRGGAHLPDLTLITPIYSNDELVGFSANRAHHADIGGSRAGSVASDSTEIYQEGIRIPPVRIVRDGAFVDEILAVILSNTRAANERRGDLRAQQAANQTGVTGVLDLIDRHGLCTLQSAFEEIKEYSARRMRQELSGIPDGRYSHEDVLEDDGHGRNDLRIAVTIDIEGETARIDFSDTAAQSLGPINAVLAVTTSATFYAMRALTDPSIPPNQGCYRPISISAPEGSIVNAEEPAAVVGGNLETSQRIVDVILGAFAARLPERTAAASQGTMNNVTLGGIDPNTGDEFTFYETQPGGYGGRRGLDGMDGVQVHMTNTMNTPAEVLETAYPLRVRQYSLRADSGGAGEFRGGLGIRRDIEVLTGDITCSILGERRRRGPPGIAGGKKGATGADVLLVDGEEHQIPAKSTHNLTTGDILSIRTPGGGGYGTPTDRTQHAIRNDLDNGKVTPQGVREMYGRYLPDENDR